MAAYASGNWDEALARSRARMDTVRREWDARSAGGAPNLESSRKYYSGAGSRLEGATGLSPIAPEVASGSGVDSFGATPMSNAAMASAAAGSTLQQIGQVEAAEELAAAQREAARQRSQGGLFGGILQTVGSIGGALIACDERVKCDIAPLQSAAANDELAQLAHLVQELREHAR